MQQCLWRLPIRRGDFHPRDPQFWNFRDTMFVVTTLLACLIPFVPAQHARLNDEGIHLRKGFLDGRKGGKTDFRWNQVTHVHSEITEDQQRFLLILYQGDVIDLGHGRGSGPEGIEKILPRLKAVPRLDVTQLTTDKGLERLRKMKDRQRAEAILRAYNLRNAPITL